MYGVPLRYDHLIEEIFVKDGVIAAVKYRYRIPQYHFDKSYVVKYGEVTKIWENFGKDEEGIDICLYRCLCLQPIIYGKDHSE